MTTGNNRPTTTQGQYLSFIYYYTKLNKRPPAEADIQRYFGTTAPSVHSMLSRLQEHGFIQRQPGVPRSIRICLAPHEIPDLD